MALEFYNLIKHHADKAPDRPSIIDGETTVTYAELLEQVEHFAGGLSNLELNSQSKLGLLCFNQKEYLVALMGAFLKGLPVIPFNFLLTPEDLIYITQDAGIDIIIAESTLINPETTPFIQSFKNKILVNHANMTGFGDDTQAYEKFLESGQRSKTESRHQRANFILT